MTSLKTHRIGLMPFLVAMICASSMSTDRGCQAQGNDESLFTDNHPQLAWRTMHPREVFFCAFEGLALDRSTCSQRAEIAWRVWRGADPDKLLPGDDAATKAVIRERWWNVDPVDEFEKVFAVAAADLPGTPRELAERAWLGIHGLAQERMLPTRTQWLNESNDRVERYALARMLSVLKVSAAQQHAIELAHERFLEVHRLFLNRAYDTFDETRADLDKRLARQPMFQLGPDDPPPGERRDQLRLAAFQRTYHPGGDGRISPTAYAEDLLGELMAALVDLREAAAQSHKTGYAGFVEHVQAILTDEQAAALPEAHNAYEIGRIVASGGASASSAVNMVSPRFDARLLIDPTIEPLRALPEETNAFREALDNFADSHPPVYAAIRSMIARYEANWLAADEQMRLAEPRVSPLQLLAYEIEQPSWGFKLYEQQLDRDARSLTESVSLQNEIAQLLMGDAELHEQWIDATNRLIHRLLYSRWPALDIEDEFDAAIHDARAAEPNDPKLSAALSDMRELYLVERDEIEARLIEASLGMGEMACWYRPPHGSTAGPIWNHRQAMMEAVARRDWYRNHIQLLTNGGADNV